MEDSFSRDWREGWFGDDSGTLHLWCTLFLLLLHQLHLRSSGNRAQRLGSPVLESTLRPRDGGSHSSRKQEAWSRTARPSVVSSRQTFKMAAQVEMEESSSLIATSSQKGHLSSERP